MSSLKDQQRKIIETMQDGEVLMIRAEFERECRDADKICKALGLTMDEFRTLGGSLRVQRIINRIAAMHDRYNELIMAVAQKWPNETRHQTALRYIQQQERACDTTSAMTSRSGE